MFEFKSWNWFLFSDDLEILVFYAENLMFLAIQVLLKS